MRVTAYAAHRASAPLEEYTYEAGPLGDRQVDIRVTHCGVCHTDLGMIDNEFGNARFPVVAGHEVVGEVAAIGAAVDPDRLPVGVRVGLGAIAGSCFRCEWCVGGRQQHCPDRDDLVLRGDRGGFARHVRAGDWRHVHPIPEAIPSAAAGPLLCAGTTVFAPLLRHGVRPTDRVGVVGIGGLGHLAVQFFAAWGCAVTAISSSPGKEDDARRFGATGYLVGRDEAAMGAAAGSFDFLLSTVAADLPWDAYLALLRPAGTLSVVGVPPAPLTVGPMALLPSAKTISGGIPGSIGDTRAMLDFAARHGVRPEVEVFPVADNAAALDRVRSGRARYRAVLEL
ncbi:NAD(P)-dependent alcohol dehydrogenase [Dactylosporangium sp. NPDC051541]|uniref:NAD(P)-dependent alcohol dehydrogenase n=1 Tax=Dactylosporangium sp. NPDC051541 TaxID=3363977 RepID=UPI003794E25E